MCKVVKILSVVLTSLVLVTSCGDSSSKPVVAAALSEDDLIPGTTIRREDLPFTQFESARLPLKIAGLWQSPEKSTYEYIFISLDGVQSNYLRTNSGCLTVMGPNKLSYYRENRYVYKRKSGHETQLEYIVNRTSMRSQEVSTGGAGSSHEYVRVSDYQPEDLDVCRRDKRRGHPYR